MQPMRHLAPLSANGLLCGVAVLGALSCNEGDDDGANIHLPDAEVRYHTKYLDIAPLSDTPVCAGTLAMMDAHVAHTVGLLDLPLSRRILMYLRQPEDRLPEFWCSETWTGHSAPGCYWNQRDLIFTNYEAMAHEIVHAITDEIGNDSWWIEGAARGISQGPPLYADFFTGWSDLHGESGHLSRWLVERYGGETYMELYETTPRNADQATVEAAVRDVLGAEFDDVLSTYAATAAYVYPNHWSCYVPPGSSESPWIGDYWEHEVTLDCDQPNTFNNGDTTKQRMTARIPVTIPREGPYHFFADHPDAELFLQPCPTEPLMEPTPEAYSWPLSIPSTLIIGASTMAPGPYVLIVNIPPGEPTTLRLVGYLAIQ